MQSIELLLIFGGAAVVVGSLLVISQAHSVQSWWQHRQIQRLLAKLDQNDYQYFQNVVLQSNQGHVLIDYLVVSQMGIFVVSTQNITGKIYGNDWKKHWLQKSGLQRKLFANPFYEQTAIIQVLEKQLQLPHHVFHSIIIFPKRARLCVRGQQHTLKKWELLATIQMEEKRVLTAEEVSEVGVNVRNCNHYSPQIVREVVRQKKIHVQKRVRQQIERGICPQCGSILHAHQNCANTRCQYTVKKQML
ncbi:MAG: nuclease-related domain-containing protein [Culicoidibacterales bacterium]